jgi:hypothetical protein
MRRFLAPLAAIAMFALLGPAWAGESTGTIKEIDLEAQEITLENGESFRIAGASLEGIQPGDTVKIQWFQGDEYMEATAIEKVNM